MPHSRPDIDDLLAQQDATAIPQPGVVPRQKGPARAISGIMQALGAVLGHQTPGLPEGTASGPGPMEWLSPEGAAAGVAKASLPLFGRAARGPVTDVADDVRFLDRVIGDMPADDFWSIFNRAGSDEAIEVGAMRADRLDDLKNIIRRDIDETGKHMGFGREDSEILRSLAMGQREMVQSQRGRATLAAMQKRRGDPTMFAGDLAQSEIDDAAIRTLLEDIIGFSGEVTR